MSNIFSSGDFLLLAVFFILTIMSSLSWYLIVWKGLKLRNEYNFYQNFCRDHASSINWPQHKLPKKVEGSINVLLHEVNKLHSVLDEYDHDEKREIITTHLLQALDKIRVHLDKGLTILASIGSISPFVGLFGTVWGIYNALAKIAVEGNAGLSAVSGPVGEALITTAFGLFAAIPAVIAYNSFVRYNRLLVQNLRHLAEQMTVYLSISAKKQKITK